MKIYISGKVSGLPLEEAIEKFQLAETRLRLGGYEPVNPMKLNPTPGLSWEEYMLSDIKHLFECKAILMLPCWGSSKGARIERSIAQEHGLAVVYQDNYFIGKLLANALSDRINESGKVEVRIQGNHQTPNIIMGDIQILAEKFELDYETALQLVHENKQYGLY